MFKWWVVGGGMQEPAGAEAFLQRQTFLRDPMRAAAALKALRDAGAPHERERVVEGRIAQLMRLCAEQRRRWCGRGGTHGEERRSESGG